MKTIIQIIAVALIIMATACERTDFDGIMRRQETQQSQLDDIEVRLKEINTNIASMQSLIKALEGKDYVTGVKPLTDGTGYVITFEKSGDVTIKHGTKGDKGEKGNTPLMGVKQHTDGKYYWTVDNEFLLDGGQKVPVTGEEGAQGQPGKDAIAPKVRININTNEWEISIDGGTAWTTTGVKATGNNGDPMFSTIDFENPDFVELTLSDGTTKIKLPRYGEIFVGFDSYDTFYCSEEANEIKLLLPSNFKESDYTNLIAMVTPLDGTTDMVTRFAGSSQWGVKVERPVFENGTLVPGSAKVRITLPENKTDYRALLRVALVDSKGREHSVLRSVWFRANGDANVIDNTTGSLEGKVTAPATVKQLSVIGTLSNADFKFIRDNMTALEILDLSRTTLTELPTRAMAFYTQQGYNGNKTLHTVILPETLRKTGWAAFGNCNKLVNVNLPEGLTDIGGWTFEWCYALASVTIPKSVITLGNGAFASTSIQSITIPTSIKRVPDFAFQNCTDLERITLHDEITEMGQAVFLRCRALQKIKIPAGVTVIRNNTFDECASLEYIGFHDGITEIGERAFGFCRKLKGGDVIMQYFTLPSCLTTMGIEAFGGCESLVRVKIPALENIPNNAFSGCTKLEEIILPNNLKTIGAFAFGESLIGIEIPASVTSIGNYAFYNCTRLGTVRSLSMTAPRIEAQTFNPQYKSIRYLFYPQGSDYSSWFNYFVKSTPQ